MTGAIGTRAIRTGAIRTGAIRIISAAVLLAVLAGCASMPAGGPMNRPAAIEAELRAHVDTLASDEFQGRRPGTDGERKTLRYLADAWEAAGLQSGTNDPAHPWLAPVELAVRLPEKDDVAFKRGEEKVDVTDGAVRIFTTGRQAILADAPLVFVGTEGESVDRSLLTGRVALMMWDHPAREEQRAALLANGAAAAIAIVLEPAEFAQLVRFREAGAYRLAGDDSASTIDGYVGQHGAGQLLGEARLVELLEMAESTDFTPVTLDLTINAEMTSAAGALRTHNLIGKLAGRNPDAGAVLMVAHWDHFGLCGDPEIGRIYCSGAVDNASGLAVLTAAAKRLALGDPLDRDVYFLATTAEEWGLLGATAFARDPPLPLENIVAAFNLDSVGIAGRGGQVAVVGAGLTSLDSDVDRVLEKLGRERADDEYSQRFVRRQDGWALLQRDVPTLMVSSAFADRAAFDKYSRERYHRSADRPDLVELGGAGEDLLLHVELVRHFASLAQFSGPGSGPRSGTGSGPGSGPISGTRPASAD